MERNHQTGRGGILRDGRLVVIVLLALYIGGVAVSRDAGHDLFKTLAVPSLQPTFLDMHAVTHTWDCRARGDYGTTEDCPRLNYPRLMTYGNVIGLGEDDARWLAWLTGATLVAMFLALLGRIGLLEGLLAAGVLLSPPVMLGLERGNPDVWIIALIGGLAFLGPRWDRLLAGALVVLAWFKLYPAFSLIALLRSPHSRRALVLFAISCVAVIGYFLATFDDVRYVDSATYRSLGYSYGYLVIQDGFADGFGLWPSWLGISPLGSIPRPVAMLVAAAVLVFAVLRFAPSVASVERREDVANRAFWLGGAVFVACWFFGTNFDYRLSALLLVLPLMLRAMRRADAAGTWTRRALGAMLVALWLSNTSYFGFTPPQAFPIDELLLFAVMIYVGAVGVATAPPWIVDRLPLRR